MNKAFEYAVHYEEIISFIPSEEDIVTKRIIKYFQEYVNINLENNFHKIKLLDKIVYEYLYNLKFNTYAIKFLEEVEKEDNFNYYNNLDINLPKLYKMFEKETLEFISSSRWL